MERTYLNRLDRLEADYKKDQRQLESSLEAVYSEKQNFRRELEALAENYRYQYRQIESDAPLNMNRVYQQLEHCQAEGNQLVQRSLNKLEIKKEESRLVYWQETKKVEEELTLLKVKERKN